MDLRFSHFEILTGTGALFLCLVFVALFIEAPAIQEEIGSEAAEAVRRQNLFWVSVQAHGQHLVLTGAAPDYLAKRQAGEIAADVHGATAVENKIAIIGEEGTCQIELDRHLKGEPVTFKAGRAELADRSFPVLGLVASVARNCDAAFEVASHTDAEGDSAINLKLSQRRAEVVVRYLVQSGVDPERLRAVGYGESQPVADNQSADGRAANQRLEFRVLGDAA